MTDPAPQTAEPASPVLDPFVMLDELARQGMTIAHAITRHAATLAEGAPSAETVELLDRLSRAHGRVTRTVRLSFLLKDHLLTARQDRDNAATANRTVQTKSRKVQIVRTVERIARDRLEGVEAIYLTGKARDRLDRDDIYGDVLTRPASELIAMICKDLGLDPDWSKLAQEAWAREEVESGEVGWPFAGVVPSPFELPETQQKRSSG